MRATLANSAQTISLAIFFTIIIISLNSTLPGALSMAVTNAGAPLQVARVFGSTPPTSALFGAFLGYNPIKTILSTLPPSLVSSIPAAGVQQLMANTFFSNAIASPFMTALREAFVIGAVMCFGALSSAAFHLGREQVFIAVRLYRQDGLAPAGHKAGVIFLSFGGPKYTHVDFESVTLSLYCSINSSITATLNV